MSHAFVPTQDMPHARPTWAPVDDDTGSLLDLLSGDDTVSTDYERDREWEHYVWCLEAASELRDSPSGAINPNDLRDLTAGRIKPQRVGAFTHRALSQGLVEYTGAHVTSTDRHGRNSGKPARELRWIGEAS